MARNTILPSKRLPTSLAIALRVRDVVLLRISFVRYPVVTIEFLFICPEDTAAFAFETKVVYTVDVLAVWWLENCNGKVEDLLIVCA